MWLTAELLDCSDDEAMDILEEQLSQEGVTWDIFGSIPCNPWST